MSASDTEDTPPSFEDCLRDLQQIASRLEDGSAGLESSLLEFERGVNLLRVCYQRLATAEQRVEQLVRIQESGAAELTPFDATATIQQPAAAPGRRRGGKPAATLLPDDSDAAS